MTTDYSQDMDMIRNSRFIFPKDNYNHVIQDVIQHKISKIYVNPSNTELVTVNQLLPEEIPDINQYHLSAVNPMEVNSIVSKAADSNINVYYTEFSSNGVLAFQHILGDLFNIVSFAFPIFLLILILSSINNSVNNNFKFRPPNGMMNPFGGEKDNFVKPNVSLSNWAGSPEVLEECQEVISYIDKKELFKTIGAEMPRGILLEGPPGTGKTLLAKMIATETNSSFISVSGSSFVELFVGMGAAKVRDLFEDARENRPCIVFIDEIDAVGKKRGQNLMASNDEREQTLNQLLYEMDGFNDNEDILIMAATNRKDILDDALLRPGRFDRIIRIPLPDKESRKKIIELYLENKPIEKPLDTSAISELTDGFSGAELKNLVNEAAILSAKNNYSTLQEKYIYESFEKSIVGLIRKNASVPESTKRRVALHEAGHSLLVLQFPQYFDFKKASIQSTYNGAGGYTLFTEKTEIKDGGLYTKDLLKKRLIITMGGKAAESIYYGNDFVSMGAIQDLKQANGLAKKMVGNFGMGNKLEVFFNEDLDESITPSFTDKYSDQTKKWMDKESLDLVIEAYNEAKCFLSENKDKLIQFARILETNTIIYGNPFPKE
jgi:cell division protease FtsH